MKNILGFVSLLAGIITCLLVFIDYFQTPPLAITVFAGIGIVLGLYTIKKTMIISTIGVILSTISFLYLVYLFIALGA